MKHEIIKGRFETAKHFLKMKLMEAVVVIDIADIITFLRHYEFNNVHIFDFDANDTEWPQAVIDALTKSIKTCGEDCFLYFIINDTVEESLRIAEITTLFKLLGDKFLSYDEEDRHYCKNMLWGAVKSDNQPKSNVQLCISIAEAKNKDDVEFNQKLDDYIDQLLHPSETTL